MKLLTQYRFYPCGDNVEYFEIILKVENVSKYSFGIFFFFFFSKIRYWNISKIYIYIDIDYTEVYIYIYVFEEQKYNFWIILKSEEIGNGYWIYRMRELSNIQFRDLNIEK